MVVTGHRIRTALAYWEAREGATASRVLALKALLARYALAVKVAPYLHEPAYKVSLFEAELFVEFVREFDAGASVQERALKAAEVAHARAAVEDGMTVKLTLDLDDEGLLSFPGGHT